MTTWVPGARLRGPMGVAPSGRPSTVTSAQGRILRRRVPSAMATVVALGIDGALSGACALPTRSAPPGAGVSRGDLDRCRSDRGTLGELTATGGRADTVAVNGGIALGGVLGAAGSGIPGVCGAGDVSVGDTADSAGDGIRGSVVAGDDRAMGPL